MMGPEQPVESGKLKVLSLACSFPNPREEDFGIFVATRLKAIAGRIELRVVAPVNPGRYWRRRSWSKRLPAIPRRRRQGEIQVYYPRWTGLPGGGVLNCGLLFARLAPMLAVLRRRWRFQLLDAQFGYLEAVVAALASALAGVPFTVTLRGSEAVHAQKPMRRRLMGWAWRRAARVVTVSARLREFAISLGVDPMRVTVIPNGVDAGVFHPRDRSSCRARHGLGDPDRVILTVGSLIPLKGHHLVVEALAGLRRRGHRATVWVVGRGGHGGSYEDHLRQTAADVGVVEQVRFWGLVGQEELAGLMSVADVLCLASSSEGWPNVVNEALSCGTPVVAHDVGAVPEMLPRPGLGIIVPPGDAAALESALALALERDWNRDEIAAWGRARSWEQVASDVETVWNEVVREHWRDPAASAAQPDRNPHRQRGVL